jgi:hypothetical protein
MKCSSNFFCFDEYKEIVPVSIVEKCSLTNDFRRKAGVINSVKEENVITNKFFLKFIFNLSLKVYLCNPKIRDIKSSSIGEKP